MPGSTRSGDEALRLTSELACTGKRAEEVGGAFVQQPAGRVFRVDRHPADGIQRQSVLSGITVGECREDVDRFPNISELVTTARLIEDAPKLRCQRGGVPR